MRNSEDILFYGGINTDDEDRLMPDGDYREAVYLRGQSFVAGSGNVLQNLPGNLLTNNPSLAGGTNEVIGACPWYETLVVFYFVWNSAGNHSIWRHNVSANTIALVVQNANLNFQRFQKIVNAFVVNGTLYWTDGYFSNYLQVTGNSQAYNFNPPRALNLDAVSGYPSFDFQCFDAIKWPPRFAPGVEYNNNPNPAINLYGRLYQFVYRYIYEKNAESVWSPISDLPLPKDGYWMSGENTLSNTDNQIDVTYNSGHFTVKKVQLAVRIGNDGEFRVFKTIDKAALGLANNTNYTVPFINDTYGESLPLNIPQFDYLPQVAGCQELLPGRGGEIAYGDVRESFDPVGLQVTLHYDAYPVPDNQRAALPWARFYNNTQFNFVIVVPSTGSNANDYFYNVGDIITFQLIEPIGSNAETYFYEVQPTDVDYATLLISIRDYFISLGFTATIVPPPTGGGVQNGVRIDGRIHAFPSAANNGDMTLIRPVRPIRTWKTGTIHNIGVKYEDRANRSGAVQYVPAGQLVIPSYSQIDTSAFVNTRLAFYLVPRIEINHNPPEWATHYRICTQHSINIESFGMYGVYGSGVVQGNSMRKRIILEGFYQNQFGVRPVHQIAKGDKVRFIRKGANFEAAFDYLPPYVGAGQDVVLTVMEYVAGGANGLDYIDVEYFDDSLYTNQSIFAAITARWIRGCQIEIYRERQTAEIEPWFETPQAIEIRGANTAQRAHNGSRLIDSVVSMDDGTQQIIVSGDITIAVGRAITISGAGGGNDGVYTITTATYDFTNDETTITVVETIPATTTGGSYVIALNQTNTFPAVVLLGGKQGCGDIYIRQRYLGTGMETVTIPIPVWQRAIGLWHEDPAYSDYFNSSWFGRGRIAIEDPNERTKRLKGTVVHSKNYLQDTNINGLHTFEFQDRENLLEMNGILERLVVVGDTLMCIQERENTSIYLQKSLSVDPNGSVTFASSSKTFADKRPRMEFYGTAHPESVVKTDMGVFYYDVYNGKFIWASNNGQKSISDGEYKFNAGSAALTSRFQNLANFFCVGFHDMENNEIGWSFRADGQNITVVFNYEIGRWKYFMTHRPDWVMWNGEVLVEWNAGQLYRMNQELSGTAPNYNTFFGTIRDSSVTFLSRNPPTLIKRWSGGAIGVKSHGSSAPWALQSMTIPANLSYTQMNTFIPSSSFKIREGIYWASYKKDVNSPNFASIDLALVNGRELRGIAAEHKLLLSGEDEKTTLFSVHISNIVSEVKK